MDIVSPSPDTKLDAVIFNPESLTIRISYKCNIGCRFCYNTSLIDSDIALDEDRMLALIKDGRKAGFCRLGISGGEAFIYAKSVIKMIMLAKEVGYSAVSIVSNGFWGKSLKSTKNIISSLENAGFSPPKDMLSMSAGEFHQEWIPPSYAKNIISEFNRTFGTPFTIDFEITKGKEHLIQEFHDFMAEHGIQEDAYKIRQRTVIANLGRGKDLAEDMTAAKPIGAFGKCKAINRFVVQPTGKVVPCCGFNRFNEGIELGDINKNSITDVINDANSNIVNQYLTHEPLHGIYKKLREHFDLPENFTVACELCEVIFGKKEHIDFLVEEWSTRKL